MPWPRPAENEMTMTEREIKRPPSGASKKSGMVASKAVAGKLRAYYEEIAAQDVPDRFLELLDKLDERDK